jgi:hypothetical protein
MNAVGLRAMNKRGLTTLTHGLTFFKSKKDDFQYAGTKEYNRDITELRWSVCSAAWRTIILH